MTYQIRDGISIDDREYGIERCTNREELFNPNAYGIKSVDFSSACWRGFYCDYAVVDRQLLLMNVNIEPTMPDRLKFKYGRSDRQLFGKSPELNKTGGRSPAWIYRDLGHSIPYSGGMLLVSGGIMMRLEDRIYYPIYVYERVCEAVFESGHLISFVDRSEQMVKARDRIIKYNEQTTSLFHCEIEAQILADYFHHEY